MTTVKIAQKDRDAVAKVCAMISTECYFLENIQGELLTCVIYADSPAILFYLGRSVQIQVEIEDSKAII